MLHRATEVRTLGTPFRSVPFCVKFHILTPPPWHGWRGTVLGQNPPPPTVPGTAPRYVSRGTMCETKIFSPITKNQYHPK